MFLFSFNFVGALSRAYRVNVLTGNLSETSFADLVQLYTLSRQTAALTIVSPEGPEHDGVIYAFCSIGCRTRFIKEPATYLSANAPSSMTD